MLLRIDVFVTGQAFALRHRPVHELAVDDRAMAAVALTRRRLAARFGLIDPRLLRSCHAITTRADGDKANHPATDRMPLGVPVRPS